MIQLQGSCVNQPKVGAQHLPWVQIRKWKQPQRGCGHVARTRAL